MYIYRVLTRPFMCVGLKNGSWQPIRSESQHFHINCIKSLIMARPSFLDANTLV